MKPFLSSCLVLVVAASSAAAAESVGTGPSFKGPVGLQLYSLRGEFTRNVPTTLKKVRDLGFTIV
ncbi:MAG: sugar phosphate isomerase/epimerase, partial [Verrucomicrobia subdivision 3 bacterium]|nr:sugar phosphate isomerase/epimerase [Limisphaerales bacterium]